MTVQHPPENERPFLRIGILLFEQMENEITKCKAAGLEEDVEMQCCFDIASNYRVKLLDMVADYKFKSQLAEIFFFKNLKPMFTAEVEFLSYCYHAHLFKKTTEDNDPMEIEVFYRRQFERLERFKRENHEFYIYVTQEKSENDKAWFTRCDSCDVPEFEIKRSTSHDKLMGTYLALKKYMAFIEIKLKELQHQ